MPDMNFTDLFEEGLPKGVTVEQYHAIERTNTLLSVHLHGTVEVEDHELLKMTESQARAYVRRAITKAKLDMAGMMDEMAMELRKGA